MSLTIKDVAREAGVSPSTVSKVINNSPSISEATVKHVDEIMKKLNYFPNTQARNFAKQTTQNIVFLTKVEPHIAFNNPHMFEIMCGVQDALIEKDYGLSFLGVKSNEEAFSAAEHIIAQKSADGLAIHGSATTKRLTELLVKSNFPHIIIGKPDFETQACWIDTNNFLSGRVAAQYLFKCGLRRTAFIGGNPEDKIFNQRLNGFLDVMKEENVCVPPHFIKYGNNSSKSGLQLMNDLLDCTPRPDSVICEDNVVTFGAIRSIQNHNLEIPEDIDLICFDNYPLSEIMDSMPTVVDIDVHDMGTQAGIFLLKKIRKPGLQVQTFTTLPVLKVSERSIKVHGKA